MIHKNLLEPVVTTNTDKSRLLAIFDFSKRVYLAAIQSFNLTRQLDKFRQAVKNFLLIKKILHILEDSSNELKIDVESDEVTIYVCGPLKIYLESGNIIAKWEHTQLYTVVYNFEKVEKILDEIFNDQVVLLNTLQQKKKKQSED